MVFYPKHHLTAVQIVENMTINSDIFLILCKLSVLSGIRKNEVIVFFFFFFLGNSFNFRVFMRENVLLFMGDCLPQVNRSLCFFHCVRWEVTRRRLHIHSDIRFWQSINILFSTLQDNWVYNGMMEKKDYFSS